MFAGHKSNALSSQVTDLLPGPTEPFSLMWSQSSSTDLLECFTHSRLNGSSFVSSILRGFSFYGSVIVADFASLARCLSEPAHARLDTVGASNLRDRTVDSHCCG